MDRTCELKAILGETFHWHKSRLQLFTEALLALFAVRTVNLAEIALAMTGNTQASSRYRRLQRFFAQVNIDFTLLARWIFKLFIQTDDKVYLCLDRTNWYWGKQPVNALVLSIAYEGIAIPIYWQLLHKDGTSNTQERIDIMQKFIDSFGADCVQCLLADREFIGGKWFSWLNQHKIPFCIRLKENTKVNVLRGKGKAIKYLFNRLTPKSQSLYENYVNVFGHSLRIAAGRSEKGELLIVATTLSYPKQAVSVYLRRWEIESLFAALKTHGFNFESTHLTEPDRIEKLLALLAVGFCWAHKVGEWRALKKPIYWKLHKDGTRRPQYTYFRYGLDYIREAILNIQLRWRQFIQCLRLISPVLAYKESTL